MKMYKLFVYCYCWKFLSSKYFLCFSISFATVLVFMDCGWCTWYMMMVGMRYIRSNLESRNLINKIFINNLELSKSPFSAQWIFLFWHYKHRFNNFFHHSIPFNMLHCVATDDCRFYFRIYTFIQKTQDNEQWDIQIA